MQTIVRNGTNISLYYLTDSKTVDITSTETTIREGGTIELTIQDCNSSNVTLRTDVDEQAAYWGHKYKHDGSSWSANADFKGINNLTSNIDDSVTTIPVGTSNPFTASGTVQIGDEKIAYTGVDGTNLTGCTRASASTSAASHTADAQVTQV